MNNFPFKDYDFWAYLSSGFLFLFCVDHVTGTGLFAKEQWTVIQGAIVVSAAYVVGHLAASISSMLFERILVGRVLGPPRLVLFDAAKTPRLVRMLMPGYFQPLPENARNKALEKGSALGIQGPGEDLFWPAYDVAKNNPTTKERLQSFLNQYGFCRNVALVALADAAILAASHQWFCAPRENLAYAIAAAVIGVGMLFRYLKFYRLYAVEVFTSFAYAK